MYSKQQGDAVAFVDLTSPAKNMIDKGFSFKVSDENQPSRFSSAVREPAHKARAHQPRAHQLSIYISLNPTQALAKLSIENDKTQTRKDEQLARHKAAIADSVKYEQFSAETTSGRANGYIADMKVDDDEPSSSQSTDGIDGLGANVVARAAAAKTTGDNVRQRATDQRKEINEAKNAKARAARKAAASLNGGESTAKRCWRTAHAALGAPAAPAAPAAPVASRSTCRTCHTCRPTCRT
jgi:hypothetical protein